MLGKIQQKCIRLVASAKQNIHIFFNKRTRDLQITYDGWGVEPPHKEYFWIVLRSSKFGEI